MPSHINAYTTSKQYQSIHGCINHQNIVSVVSFQISLCLSLCQNCKFQQTNSLKIIIFHQKCHPQCVGSRDVTNQSFQVTGPNNRTTCILPFNFYHMPSGKSEQPDNWHLPFISQSFRVANPNNRIACVSFITFIMFQVASPKQRTT